MIQEKISANVLSEFDEWWCKQVSNGEVSSMNCLERIAIEIFFDWLQKKTIREMAVKGE